MLYFIPPYKDTDTSSVLFPEAELKQAIQTWPHSDPVSWAQRTTAVALVKRLDQSLDKSVTALQQSDPKYYGGETHTLPGCTWAPLEPVYSLTFMLLSYTRRMQLVIVVCLGCFCVSCSEFEPLLTWRFWLVPQSWISTDPSLVYSSTLTSECYDEQLSDKCLTLLLGTWWALTQSTHITVLWSVLTVPHPDYLIDALFTRDYYT